MGRPSVFTDSIADTICEALADGQSLRTICLAEGMPNRATVFRWLVVNETFRDQYARARDAQAEALADEILDIADDGSNDWMERFDDEGGNIGWKENGEAMARSKLRVEARKWVASKLMPRKYGEAALLKIAGADGEGPVKVAKISREMTPEEAAQAYRDMIAE